MVCICAEVYERMNFLKFKKNLLLILFILAAIVLGALLADLVRGSAAAWLSYGLSFGLNNGNPFVLDLYILKLTFGLSFSLNVAQLFLIIVALLIYKPISKHI